VSKYSHQYLTNRKVLAKKQPDLANKKSTFFLCFMKNMWYCYSDSNIETKEVTTAKGIFAEMSKSKKSSITFDEETFDEGMRAVFNAVCDDLKKDGYTRGRVMNMAIMLLGDRFLGEDKWIEVAQRERRRIQSIEMPSNRRD
jgi:hypothetical protein